MSHSMLTLALVQTEQGDLFEKLSYSLPPLPSAQDLWEGAKSKGARLESFPHLFLKSEPTNHFKVYDACEHPFHLLVLVISRKPKSLLIQKRDQSDLLWCAKGMIHFFIKHHVINSYLMQKLKTVSHKKQQSHNHPAAFTNTQKLLKGHTLGKPVLKRTTNSSRVRLLLREKNSP